MVEQQQEASLFDLIKHSNGQVSFKTPHGTYIRSSEKGKVDQSRPKHSLPSMGILPFAS